MNEQIAQMMVFAAVMLIVLGVDYAFKGKGRSQQRKQKTTSGHPLFNWFDTPIASLASMIEPMVNQVFPGYPVKVKQALLSAAKEGIEYWQIIGAQALMAMILFIGGLALGLSGDMNWPGTVMIAVLATVAGGSYPWIWLSKAAEARKLQISKQLPYALDLLTTAVEAGQDFNAALRYLTRYGLTGPLAEEFLKMLREIDLGQTRQDALRRLALRINTDECMRFTTAISQSVESGSSLSSTLRMQAQDLRRMRFQLAERQAARAPSLMIIPMALFILPGIFIVVFTPVILRVMQSMGKM